MSLSGAQTKQVLGDQFLDSSVDDGELEEFIACDLAYSAHFLRQ